MIQADAADAGLAITLDSKDGPLVLDFHSLRGTFATLLDGLDITLKARQELMRHSDPRLTMNRYTRAKLRDLGAAVDKLPAVRPATPPSEPAVLRATGTDGGCSSDAVPDAVGGGSGRLRLRTGEETGGPAGDPDPEPAGNNKPLRLQGFEDCRGQSEMLESGEGGIRTRGAMLLARRFSKDAPSSHNPSHPKAVTSGVCSGCSAGCSADPDFVRLAAAWPTIPDPIRQAMLAMIDSGRPGG
jgi:hypothetical protein